jgi:hypothetical protein
MNPFFEVMLYRAEGETLMIKRPLEEIHIATRSGAEGEVGDQTSARDRRSETGDPALRSRRKDLDIVVVRFAVDPIAKSRPLLKSLNRIQKSKNPKSLVSRRWFAAAWQFKRGLRSCYEQLRQWATLRRSDQAGLLAAPAG